ncbi:SGNH/GDSL hydrolase family protein [Candidatus Gottesmanbacteria bacterium]|nr:SGNH/GDSL hydrolase family protein [Candidatus Gottesmanbacteria bacterium]
MTKISQVISFFIIISFLFFAARNSSYAQNLVRPIPDNNQTDCHAEFVSASRWVYTVNSLKNLHVIPKQVRDDRGCESNYAHSVTFGDLLNRESTGTNNTETAGVSAKATAIKELLDRLEAFYQESKKELAEFNKQSTISNFKSGALWAISNSPSPTPYIPVPTLIAGVSEIVSSQNSVLGIQSTPSPSPTINYQLTTDIGTLTQNPIRTTYTIAVLGDSMVDTLGKDLPQLRQLLSESFPNYTFALLNYGQGATDLESGLYRLTNTTNYLGQTFTPLLSFKPDILVVESFAYNHWSAEKYDLDRQWLTIAKIIDIVRENSPDTKIVLAASIAPNSDIFGDGSLNWPVNLKWEGAQITRAYLQNMVNFATSQNYPLADAYHPSLGADGKGLTKYINGGDNLHPSGDGGLLFSQKIIEAIKTNNLIK